MRRLFANKIKIQQTQIEPLRRPLPVRLVDIHSHCLAGIDDGPDDLEKSIAICRALVADGVATVIATPHQLGRYEANTAADIRLAVDRLNAKLKQLKIELKVLPGADVRVDERLVQMLETDQVMTLADQRNYILLELPHEAFIDIGFMVKQLADRGVTGIITHPERHRRLAAQPSLMDKWIDAGAILQITAGSLIGDFGPRAQKSGWHFVENYQKVVLAGDVHNTAGRGPRMRQAFGVLAQKLGQNKAIRLCSAYPAEIINQTTAKSRVG